MNAKPTPEHLRGSVAEVLATELAAVSAAHMKLRNAVEQDDHLDSWEEAMWASSELDTAVEELYDKIRAEAREREDRE